MGTSKNDIMKMARVLNIELMSTRRPRNKVIYFFMNLISFFPSNLSITRVRLQELSQSTCIVTQIIAGRRLIG
jgi:hypothetical protein